MALVDDGPQAEEVLGAILEREKQFPTGIGYGVAVPHGKTPVLSALVVVAGGPPPPPPRGNNEGGAGRPFFFPPPPAPLPRAPAEGPGPRPPLPPARTAR